MIKVWVTGARGQLGQEIKSIVDSTNIEAYFTSSADVDITKEQEVEAFWALHRFDACVNTAAFTAVDKAETEQEAAFLVNAQAVGFIAKTAQQHNARLIQISTDYVFDGCSAFPKKPEDLTNPLNIYGKTKLEGEQLAFSQNSNALVVRTSWLYGLKGKNFIKTMLRLAQTQPELKVVYDQIGSPTSATDLADAILKILLQPNLSGIYHYANTGVASWYDFAKAIFEYSAIDVQVHPVESTAFPTPAQRPKYSVMDCSKIQNQAGLRIPYWRDSLKIYLQKINKEYPAAN